MLTFSLTYNSVKENGMTFIPQNFSDRGSDYVAQVLALIAVVVLSRHMNYEFWTGLVLTNGESIHFKEVYFPVDLYQKFVIA